MSVRKHVPRRRHNDQLLSARCVASAFQRGTLWAVPERPRIPFLGARSALISVEFFALSAELM